MTKNFNARLNSGLVYTVVIAIVSLLLTGCATSELTKSAQRKIQNKTYVIVGASSGFGRGVAQKLGAYKVNVVLAARRTELLEEIAGTIRAAGGKAVVVTTDISRPEDVQRLANIGVEHFGRIDVWVNNAAVMAIGNFWDIPLEDHARLIDVNLKGYIYGTHAALKLFRSQGYGTLVNVGSVESETPLAYHASYAASKGGIRNLDKALRQELRLQKHKNIRIVTVSPWATDTPIWGHAANYSGGTARMAAIDPPDKVVNAIIWSSLHRRKEIPVGMKARAAVFSHRMFPRSTERLSANIAHRYQIKTAPPAPITKGNLYEPLDSGRNVSDGVKQRIKKENKERKRKKTPKT
jgi:short-subunit dehydrogenase